MAWRISAGVDYPSFEFVLLSKFRVDCCFVRILYSTPGCSCFKRHPDPRASSPNATVHRRNTQLPLHSSTASHTWGCVSDWQHTRATNNSWRTPFSLTTATSACKPCPRIHLPKGVLALCNIITTEQNASICQLLTRPSREERNRGHGLSSDWTSHEIRENTEAFAWRFQPAQSVK